MRVRVIAVLLVLLTLVALSTYLAAAQHYGSSPVGDFTPLRIPDWLLAGPQAEQQRRDLLDRAAFRIDPGELAEFQRLTATAPAGPDAITVCRFLNDAPSGTTAKFNCVLDGGRVIKVKYGRNPEIQGEVAGTRLLRRMGFPADDVEIVPKVRCFGCPRDPFLTVIAGAWTYTRDLLGPAGFDDGYTDFEWVSIERRFPAPAIETDQAKGWAWWELRDSAAHRADLDALRLLAVFMAHWDNKQENQRLVCLDPLVPEAGTECRRPLAMIQDLGATFGPTKVNIGSWPSVPIWADRARCRISMRTLPWKGGTFPDVEITEAGRRQLADRLAALSDDEVRELFRGARFPDFQTATADEHDLNEWSSAFRTRAREIIDAGPCPIAE